MLKFILVRLLSAIPVLIGISLVSFIIIQLPPGDFASSLKVNLINNGVSEHEAERQATAVRVQYGLDQPILIQYARWMGNIVTKGQFGYSFAYKRDVGELIAERLPRTLVLALAAHLISTLLGIFIGIYAATHQYSLGDNAATVLAFLGTSIPRFFLALLILVLAGLHGRRAALYQLQLAAVRLRALVVGQIYGYTEPCLAGDRDRRIRRRGAEYARDARQFARYAEYAICDHRALQRSLRGGGDLSPCDANALHPIIMYQGTVLPYMLAGELEAAIVLGLPTLAPMFYGSLLNQDIYVSGGFLLIYGVLLVLGNLIADVCLSLLDPRIRLN